MRILITGASGFIGRHLVARLSAGHDVICLGRRPGKDGDNVTFVKMDLAGGIDRDRLPSSIDALVHLAQSYRYNDFPEGAPDMMAVNVTAAAALYDYAGAAGADRIVIASSGNVYEPFGDALAEDRPLNPKSFYASTKLVSECLLWPYGEMMKVSALRLFYPYGPGQTDRLVPRLIENIKNGVPVTVAGGKDGIRLTPTYIDDVIDVFVSAIEEGWEGPINVAAPETVSIGRLATVIGELVNTEPVFESLNGVEPASMIPELARLKMLYDVSDFHSLGDGLKQTVKKRC